MARRRGSKKGTPFERKICDKLSKWWCGNDTDRIFWRTAGSGAMATVRGRKGKGAGNQDSDLCHIHPSGQPFTALLTVEMKKGLSTQTIHDLLDRPARSKPKMIEDFCSKARRQHRSAQTFAWLVIHERDQRNALVYYPHKLMLQLVSVGCFPKPPTPFATIDTIFREITDKQKKIWRDKKGKKHTKTWGGKKAVVREIICVTTLAKFLKRVTPEHIRILARHLT